MSHPAATTFSREAFTHLASALSIALTLDIPCLHCRILWGAAAGGFVGNTYLPAGFNDITHAGQRVTIRLGTFAAGNLFREFAPPMPRPMRTFFMLIAR